MRSLRMFFAVTSVLLLSTPVFATVLFEDDFSTHAEGALAGPAPTGSWTYDLGTTGTAYVFQGVVGDCPGAPDGSKYLGMLRGSDYWPQAIATFATQSNPADLVRFEADIFGGASPDPYIAINSGTATNNYVMAVPTGTIYVPGSPATSSLTWTTAPPAWHHVTMDYHPTATTFDLTIDAATQKGIAMGVAGPIDGFSLTNVVNNWALYDNVKVTLNPGVVPEPSSIVLLASAVLGLLAYAWRKYK
jgi:hypothetical protein